MVWFILLASRLASVFLRISRMNLPSPWLCEGLLRCDIKCHSVARAEKYQWGPSETQEVRGKLAGMAEKFKDLRYGIFSKDKKGARKAMPRCCETGVLSTCPDWMLISTRPALWVTLAPSDILRDAIIAVAGFAISSLGWECWENDKLFLIITSFPSGKFRVTVQCGITGIAILGPLWRATYCHTSQIFSETGRVPFLTVCNFFQLPLLDPECALAAGWAEQITDWCVVHVEQRSGFSTCHGVFSSHNLLTIHFWLYEGQDVQWDYTIPIVPIGKVLKESKLTWLCGC